MRDKGLPLLLSLISILDSNLILFQELDFSFPATHAERDESLHSTDTKCDAALLFSLRQLFCLLSYGTRMSMRTGSSGLQAGSGRRLLTKRVISW